MEDQAPEGAPGEAGSPQKGEEGPPQQDQAGDGADKGKAPSPAKDAEAGASQEKRSEGDSGPDAAEREAENPAEKGQGAKPDAPRDLSGELRALREMTGGGEEDRTAETAAALMDRKKADALLDNIQENRSRFMRLRVPRDRRGGVPSGKDW
jgi:Ca-activated chloride channel family protein